MVHQKQQQQHIMRKKYLKLYNIHKLIIYKKNILNIVNNEKKNNKKHIKKNSKEKCINKTKN